MKESSGAESDEYTQHNYLFVFQKSFVWGCFVGICIFNVQNQLLLPKIWHFPTNALPETLKP
jgi:hypothetical protein